MYRSVRVAFLYSASKGEYWNCVFPDSELGAMLFWANFGNPSELGWAMGIIPMAGFRLTGKSRVSLRANFGFGIAYASRIYNPVDNPRNVAISTHINLAVSMGLHARFVINRLWSVNFGASAMHLSNGVIRKPNYGLNQFSVDVGIGVLLAEKEQRDIRQVDAQGQESPYVSCELGGGVKETGDAGGPLYYPVTLSSGYVRPIDKLLYLAVWGDIMLDRSAKYHFQKTGTEYRSIRDDIQLGVRGGAELLFNKLTLALYGGVYVVNRNPRLPRLYQNIILGYAPRRGRAMLFFRLKTHLNNADHMELGIRLICCK